MLACHKHHTRIHKYRIGRFAVERMHHGQLAREIHESKLPGIYALQQGAAQKFSCFYFLHFTPPLTLPFTPPFEPPPMAKIFWVKEVVF